MNLGTAGFTELLVVLWYVLCLALVVWVIRTLSSMAHSNRDIAARLAAIEEHMRRSA